MHCKTEYAEEKNRLREEKREAKNRRREEKREAKHRRREEKREAKDRRREEKREEKQRYCEAKREEKQKYCEAKREEKQKYCEAKRQLKNQHLSPDDNVVVGYPNNSNVRYNNFNDMPLERIERDVATIRTIFPDCDPEYIRNCLAKETTDHVRKVTEKLLKTDYPKVAPVSPLTPPTAPPLPSRSSCDFPFNDEAPPSYEESLGSSSLQPPSLPKRHQRSSSWNGTPITSTQPIQQQTQTQQQRSYNNPTNDLAEAIGMAAKNFLTGLKPPSVQHAIHKNSHILMRPVPSRFNPKQFSEYKISTKDKYSIQRGFSSSHSYPSKKLHYNDISEEDWYLFINGLNSIIGANSINGSPNSLGDGFSVSLKWVSWMKVTMDEKLMESNIIAINEYLDKWNINFFNPRKTMVQFVEDKTPTNIGFFHNKEKPLVQYLSLKSI